MQIRRLMAITAATAALTTFVAGCGDTEDNSADDGSAQTESTQAGGGGGDEAASSLEFTAHDIEFDKEEASAAAGEVDVELVNEGKIEHSWVVEDHEDDLRLHAEGEGDTDQGTITLEAGTYTYYCDIPGHRDAGMEGTLTVG